MKNPIDYVEKLIKRLERKIFFYISLILIIIGGIILYNNYKTIKNNLSDISFSSISKQKAYCITANSSLSESLLKQKFNLEILKNEYFSCYKDIESCDKNIKFVWNDVIDFISDYTKVEDTNIIKAKKFNEKNQIVGAWWENNILKVYCLEVSVTPTEGENNND